MSERVTVARKIRVDVERRKPGRAADVIAPTDALHVYHGAV